MSKSVLIALTQVDQLAGEPNGTYFPELTHFLAPIVDAGWDYVLATPAGGPAPVYGDDRSDAINARFLDDAAFTDALAETRPISELEAKDFAAIYYPGGYGVLFDLVQHEGFAAIAAEIFENEGWLTAVCHGPAGLLPIKDASGEALLAGRSITSFTREEEVDYETIDKIPYLLEERLVRLGTVFHKMAPWQEHRVVDGRIVTGQNPASAAAVGRYLVQNAG